MAWIKNDLRVEFLSQIPGCDLHSQIFKFVQHSFRNHVKAHLCLNSVRKHIVKRYFFIK